jgi:hypothetical protein
MVVKNTWIACRVATFDDGLLSVRASKLVKATFFLEELLKKAKAVSCCITKHQQEKYLAIPEYNFQDFTNLYNVWTDHLSNHKEGRMVCHYKDYRLIVKPVTIFHYETELARLLGVAEQTFLGKRYFGAAKRPMKNLKDLYLFHTSG